MPTADELPEWKVKHGAARISAPCNVCGVGIVRGEPMTVAARMDEPGSVIGGHRDCLRIKGVPVDG